MHCTQKLGITAALFEPCRFTSCCRVITTHTIELVGTAKKTKSESLNLLKLLKTDGRWMKGQQQRHACSCCKYVAWLPSQCVEREGDTTMFRPLSGGLGLPPLPTRGEGTDVSTALQLCPLFAPIRQARLYSRDWEGNGNRAAGCSLWLRWFSCLCARRFSC